MHIKISKVLLLDNVDPAAKEILESNNIEAVLCKEKLPTPDLISQLRYYDGVVVRSATKITAEVMEACPKLQIIGRAGTGVDNIDVNSATRHGVAVMNTPGGNTISAAEHTCTLICCLSRNVPAADAHVKSGKWDRKEFMGHELFGKVLAIIGLGRIGLEVAHRMQSFGMKTIGYDPLVSAEVAKKYDIDWMELEEIWPQADYVTVHTPLIPQTKGLINTKVFSSCKRGMRVINCARGGIIDEECLLKALESGSCGGAGLDVFVDEPTENTKLVNHPKVVACPHLGASTKEGQARCGREIAQQFVDVNNGKSFFGVINAPALSAGTTKQAVAWTAVAKHLTLIMKEYVKGPMKYSLVLHTSGATLRGLGKVLKAAVCSGMINNDKANLINAHMLTEEMGIQITVENGNDETDSCALKASTENDTFWLSGGVINQKPVLLAVNEHTLSAPVAMSGCMMIFKAASFPNKICDVISVLGSKETMPKVMSVTSLSSYNGISWVVMLLEPALPDITTVDEIVGKALLVKF